VPEKFPHKVSSIESTEAVEWFCKYHQSQNRLSAVLIESLKIRNLLQDYIDCGEKQLVEKSLGKIQTIINGMSMKKTMLQERVDTLIKSGYQLEEWTAEKAILITPNGFAVTIKRGGRMFTGRV